MFVYTRSGEKEDVDFSKIVNRVSRLCERAPPLSAEFVDPLKVAQKVVACMATGMTTQELDRLSAETAAAMTLQHPHYAMLGGRIEVSNLHRQTEKYGRTFSEVVDYLFRLRGGPGSGREPMVSESFHACVMRNREALDAAIRHERDFELLDFFAFRTLAKTYLLSADSSKDDMIVERPQYMYMRVAVQIHGDDVPRAIETYDLLSRQMFSHATPTMHNSGLPRHQLSSCFLLPVESDSIEGIFDTVKETALISKYGGGVGLAAHHIRAAGTLIESTNGTSTGLVPMLRVFNNTAKYVDQGGGKRNGAFAIYLEPWHADIEAFLELRKNQGAEEHRARDLFYGLWIPDLFMKRVLLGNKKKDENDNFTLNSWSLFCPKSAPKLHNTHGEEFEKAYLEYEKTPGLAKRTLCAYDLWCSIVAAQIETGMPYMLYKDACNRKSNHQHLGTIPCSNLCTEIIQYSSPNEIAVCNLASIALPKFVRPAETEEKSKSAADFSSWLESAVDWGELERVTRVVTRNLNMLIDKSFYPLEKMRVSNLRHRPMGIGVQGLADMYAMLGLPYESEEAAEVNRRVFELMYLAAMDESITLAEEAGEPYPSYPGSPLSQGLLQMDLWARAAAHPGPAATGSDNGKETPPPVAAGPGCAVVRAAELLARIRARLPRTGARNSLLMAPMPTASTAQIMGNTEGMQPFPFMVFTRRVKSGEFTVVNKHLVAVLEERGLWTPEIQNAIVANQGSVQSIEAIPAKIRELFKTTWEIKQRTVIDQAADRGRYICQSQSMNLFIADPTLAKLTAMHMHAWRKGLKTGMYYLHTRPKTEPVKFTLAPVVAATANKVEKEEDADEDNTTCEHCSA